MKKKLLFLAFYLAIFNHLCADSLEISSFGKLSVTNYSPKIYEANKQNWSVCIGENGLVYFANGSLLEGGSNYWKSHHLPNEKLINSVSSMGERGILVGGTGEIGIFEFSEMPGELHYKSLLDKLDTAYYNFGSIWQIIKEKDSYLIRAGKALFSLGNDTILPLVYGEVIDYAYIINDKTYIQIAGKGLGYYENDSFQLFPFGSMFRDVKIKAITPYFGNHLLIFTDDKGVFLFDGNKVNVLESFCNKEIIESQISDVKLLDNKYYAVGTVKNGLYILNLNGEIIQHLNNKSGLQNNTILSIYPDGNNNLWLGLDYGVSFVHLNSCLSMVNSEFELGTGYVSRYFDGKLYFGSNQGLFYIHWNPDDPGNSGQVDFHPVKNTTGQVWNLHVINNHLLCGHHKGLFKIEDDEASLINPVEGSWQIEELKNHPGYFLQATYRGYYLLKLDDQMNLLSSRKIDFIPNVIKFTQENNGNIWISTSKLNLYKFRIDVENADTIDFKDFTFYKDFNYSTIRVVGNSKQVFFATDSGLFNYNSSLDVFEKANFYHQLFENDTKFYEFFDDEYDRIWFVTDKEIGYFSLRFGKFKKVSQSFNSVRNSYTLIFGKINIIDDKNIIFPVDQGFYYFNANCTGKFFKNYHAYIINVSAANENLKEINKSGIPVYPHKKNSLEFTITSDIIDTRENVFYQYKLEGYDENWSEWSTKNNKEYNNLYEGNYTFHVKAKSNSGIVSSEAKFDFQIKPPLYRSRLAILFYFILLIITSVFLRKFRMRRIELEKRKIVEKKQLELEQKKRKYEEEQLLSQQRITKLENDKLQQSLLHKSKELSNSMINILHKNEILLNLKAEMQKLYLEKDLKKRDFSIKKLIRVIESEISTKKDIEVFDTNFNAVHEEFIAKLKELYPDLNQGDHRLCTFIKMNKSTKEIATFLNMSIRGVETSRYRLRKKMNLSSDENLYDVISNII